MPACASRIVLTALLTLLLGPLAASQSPSDLAIEPAEVDLGDLYAGETGTAWVTITNTGEAGWPVKMVKTSCGCTVAEVHAADGTLVSPTGTVESPAVTIQPGEAIKVQVEFKASAPGNVEKKLMVYGTDTGAQPINVPVRARVSRVLVVTPPYVQLQTIDKRSVIENVVTLEARDIGEWDIAGFESAAEGTDLPEGMSFEVLDTEGDSRRIKVVVGGERPVGQYVGWVKVKIDHPRVHEIDFRVLGSVQPDVVFSSGHPNFPETLVFEQLDAGTKSTRTLLVQNKDPAVPYRLQSVDVRGPKKEFFEARIEEVEEGVKYQIHLTADADLGLPFFRGSLILHADHPDMPEKTIPFHGWIKKKAD